MATLKVKKVVVPEGQNIRISNSAYILIKKFCKEKGYRLGSFCELGALEKMAKEVVVL